MEVLGILGIGKIQNAKHLGFVVEHSNQHLHACGHG
jgi:hypothetical protein